MAFALRSELLGLRKLKSSIKIIDFSLPEWHTLGDLGSRPGPDPGATAKHYTETELLAWTRRLAFPPRAVVLETLRATTQHRPPQFRTTMKDHHKKRTPAADSYSKLDSRVPGLRERWFTDTLIYRKADGDQYGRKTCMQLFAGADSGRLFGYEMHSRSEVPAAVDAFLTHVGVPPFLRNDNAN